MARIKAKDLPPEYRPKGSKRKQRRRSPETPEVPPVFAAMLDDAGLPRPVPEFRFYRQRKWRFDYAWPDKILALEVEGGVFTEGRHVRGQGYVNDCEKYSKAAAMGWRILRVTPDQLETAYCVELIREAISDE